MTTPPPTPDAKLTDAQYRQLAEALLSQVEQGCDRLNDETALDLDNQRTGGLVTVTFANRSQIVINLQPPLHEVWLAAKAGGFHYKFDSARSVWACTKTGVNFFQHLNTFASQQSGETVVFG